MKMISHVAQFVMDYLSKNKDVEVLKILENDKETETDTEKEDTEICIGKITHLNSVFGVINNELHFENSYGSKLAAKMTVIYSTRKHDGETKICKILVMPEIVEQSAVKVESYNKDLVCLVESRRGREVTVSPNNITFDLDNITAAFVPVVGDWISVNCLVEANVAVEDQNGNILKVLNIAPLRCSLRKKPVTKWNGNWGVIGSNIYFDVSVVSPGFMPMVEDLVIAEMIESNQGECNWRALKVMPAEKILESNNFITNKENFKYSENKNGIDISSNLSVNLSKINETGTLSAVVVNKSPETQVLIGVTLKAFTNQLTLISPISDKKIEIIPKNSIFFHFSCTAKFMGATRELLVFNFVGFSIERYVNINVSQVPRFQPCSQDFHSSQYKTYAKAARASYSRKDFVAGQKPIRTPAFMERRLPNYSIPHKLVDDYLCQLEMCKSLRRITIDSITPCFNDEMNINNYQNRFHSLLYIEEMSHVVNLHKYDMEHTCFVKDGEYLVLEVDNLFERKPSVSIGDKIYAYMPNVSDAKKYQGFIHKVGAKHLHIKFIESFHTAYNDEDYSVEFDISRTNFRRLHLAIDTVYEVLGNIFLFPSTIQCKELQMLFETDALTYVDNMNNEDNGNKKCESNKESSSSDENSEKDELANEDKQKKNLTKESSKYAKAIKIKCLQPSPSIQLNSPSQSKAESKNVSNGTASPSTDRVKLAWVNKSLNYYQKQAVINILEGVARPLPYLIFGPPGTGKTVTLVETVLQIMRLMPHSRVLIAAPSNSAADLLALRLIDNGNLLTGDLVRLLAHRCVVSGQTPEELLPYCASVDLARDGSRDSQRQTLNGVRQDMQRSVLGRHRIIVGTCMAVGVLYTMGFATDHFTHVVIDEAGQCTEPEIMIPLSIIDVKNAQVILAGDPMQLGPCVLCYLCKEMGLCESFLQRIMDRFPYKRDPVGFSKTRGYDPRLITKLVYNYRSLPEILYLANALFYNSELQSVISPTDSPQAELLKKLAFLLPGREDSPPALVFHGVRGNNYQMNDSPSWFNPVEAGQVFYYVTRMYKVGLTPKDIGIISPYIKQCQQIRQLLQEIRMDIPKVGTVEDFQGQEFKVVILSTVRSTKEGAITDAKYGLGFVSSPSRVNVAITRAQSLLIIVGNPWLLSLDSYWRSVLKYSLQIKGYTGCDLPDNLYH